MSENEKNQSEAASENNPQETVEPQGQESAASALVSGLMGFKSGMTQVFHEDGKRIPVTVVDVRPQYAVQVRTAEKDGYQAVQVGIDPKKAQRVNKPQRGHAKGTGQPGFTRLREFLPAPGGELPQPGAALNLIKVFQAGDRVDVRAISKGKGFQGAMKRWNFHGLRKTHGTGPVHRHLGSTGKGTDPGKVFKGKKMAGQMGNKKVTVQNLEVHSVDEENQVLLLRGSVPGPKNGVLEIRPSVKVRK